LCVIAFIREVYPQLQEFADVMDVYREARHNMLYGLDPEVFTEDAEEGIRSASVMIEMVERIIELNNQCESS